MTSDNPEAGRHDAGETWDYPADSGFDALPYAYGKPPGSGLLKSAPDDFIVVEDLGFELTGSGEHVFLNIEKTGENTDYVARMLARIADVPALAVGYAGMKDRHGRTRQWFSVGLAGKPEPDWCTLEGPTIRVVGTGRHQRKLKRGALAGNRFCIRLRSVDGPRDEIESRLRQIAAGGVPNYFGPQRFGRLGANLTAARDLLLRRRMVRSRHHRGLYLSAARSYLFNRILARRVEGATWNRAITGDVFMFQLSHSVFKGDATETDIAKRVAALAIHPGGTLWGRGETLLGGDALADEAAALSACAPLCAALEQAGLERAMRPLRLAVQDLQGEFIDAMTLKLDFSLPAGTYATSVLREILDTEVEASPGSDDSL